MAPGAILIIATWVVIVSRGTPAIVASIHRTVRCGYSGVLDPGVYLSITLHLVYGTTRYGIHVLVAIITEYYRVIRRGIGYVIEFPQDLRVLFIEETGEIPEIGFDAFQVLYIILYTRGRVFVEFPYASHH